MRRRFRKISITVVVGLCMLVTGCESSGTEDQLEMIEIQETDSKEFEETTDWIYIHVCGQVKNPGVYELSSGSRVYEAIEAAGGLTKDAATETINQASLLEDGQQLLIPDRNEEAAVEDGKININQASKEELMTLSGIGESRAAAIIQYREEHNGFQSTEELMEVEGIKEGVFQKVKDLIKIS